jgi:hypothetical protein
MSSPVTKLSVFIGKFSYTLRRRNLLHTKGLPIPGIQALFFVRHGNFLFVWYLRSPVDKVGNKGVLKLYTRKHFLTTISRVPVQVVTFIPNHFISL